jgi:ubiquitin carboxyl-terminal hydrolase 36/42
MEEEAESSSAAALVLALVALVVVPTLALLAWALCRQDAAQREEVCRVAWLRQPQRR